MSTFYPATKTMQLFEDSVARDQGSSFRVWLGKVLPHIEDAYREGDGGFRTHLGVSMIGDECARKLYYNFHWAVKPRFTGKTLRLFNRGHLEEGRFVALILCSGMKIWQQDATGNQFRISYVGGHYGSAIDGVVQGCPDMPDPNTPILTEMKTHNKASFAKLLKQGVKECKYEHYVQQQVYMHAFKLPASLYLAVCKDNDEIWAEIVPFNKEIAEQYIHRGEVLVVTKEPPEKINQSGSYLACKWCDASAICHRGVAPEINCRTCGAFFTCDDGTARCVLKQDNNHITDGQEDVLTKEMQLAACEDYHRARHYGE